MRVGILGAGQLGRMLALAAHPLGLEVLKLARDPSEPACAVAPHRLCAWDDREGLARFASELDVCTFEFENVPADAAASVAAQVPMYPSPEALRIGSDRLEEKTLFRALDIDTAPFAAISSQAELEYALAEVGLPALLKTRRLGYDGKGQRLLRTRADVAGAFDALGGVDCIVEGFVRFDREVSLVAVRDTRGEMVFYPLVENHHEEGVLRLTLAPAPGLEGCSLQARAETYARSLMERFGYVGALALELFVAGDALLANEIAPRVHNSGHWTIEGAVTSQFENHVRAIAGLPLGATDPLGFSAMVNLLGAMPERSAILALPDTHLHDYAKSARAGRKVGHVTIRAQSVARRDELAARVGELAAAATATLRAGAEG